MKLHSILGIQIETWPLYNNDCTLSSFKKSGANKRITTGERSRRTITELNNKHGENLCLVFRFIALKLACIYE